MVLKFIQKLFFKYQIWKYSNRIPFFTIREYGPADSYPVYVIKNIVKKWSFNKKYIPIAYAILATEKDFNNHTKNTPISYDYFQIRQIIADNEFDGNANFTICDLLSKSYYRSGAIEITTGLPCEWDADASYYTCLYGCKEKELFNISKMDL